MFDTFGKLINRWWWAVILFWIVLTVGVSLVAESWEKLAKDGDLAYMPAYMPSVVGEDLLSKGFPEDRAKSQIVLITARDNDKLAGKDLDVALDIARRFKNYQGMCDIERARQALASAAEKRKNGKPEDEAEAERLEKRAEDINKAALDALTEAIDIDDKLVTNNEKWNEEAKENGKPAVPAPPRLAAAYWNRARLLEASADESEQRNALSDRNMAISLDPSLEKLFNDKVEEKEKGKDTPLPAFIPLTGETVAGKMPLLDVWTWDDPIYGPKLGKKHEHARLVVLQFRNEFMATQNIGILGQVEKELEPVKEFAKQLGVMNSTDPAAGVRIGISGSTSVGGDMLRSAHESIKHTEVFTVVIVVLILLCVYRSPLLVIVPLVTIFASLKVATGLIALLVQLHDVPGFEWWNLQVFTTTKIFIVVILFGSGTDFCLFLISRFREELEHGHKLGEANAKALGTIADALIASAMTTILGLGMMFFADFGKYRNSGPVIALCLFVTLMASLTLAPALLRACGTWVFWPSKIKISTGEAAPTWLDNMWRKSAKWIVAYPIPILLGSVLIMLPAGWYGYKIGDDVTYDFLSGLADSSVSKSGTVLLKKHFEIGESGPLTIVVKRPFDDSQENFATKGTDTKPKMELRTLADELLIDGVSSIRSINDPRGIQTADAVKGKLAGKPVEQKLSVEELIYINHPRTQRMYVSRDGEVTRLDVILKTDPFDAKSRELLDKLDEKLTSLKNTQGSYWENATFGYAGSTAGVRDLRKVTRSDNTRIQILVVIVVYIVLLCVLRRPVVCLYMILSVLFSYYVTIGLTRAFFEWAYAPNYPGMDWKVPLFLFVILVAVGEDYNVFLATRVYEEQKKRGPFSGLRHAIVRTGGIITSCGVIMAGTFVSMTAGVWGELLPPSISKLFFAADVGALRGIVELGFALTLGVMLDTFIVRPILVPAFMALMAQWEAKRPRKQRGNKEQGLEPGRGRSVPGPNGDVGSNGHVPGGRHARGPRESKSTGA